MGDGIKSLRNADLAEFWGVHFVGLWRGCSTPKMSGIGHLWFLELCWKFYNRFQVVLPFQLISLDFGEVILSVWRGPLITQNVSHWSLFIPGIMLDILQHVSSGYLSRCSSSSLGVPLIIPHDHTHQVLHGRPPIPCTGSHTR